MSRWRRSARASSTCRPRRSRGVEISEATLQRIDEAVRGIITRAFERATAVLHINREVLERSARALLERETLDEQMLDELTADLQVRPEGDIKGA